MELDAGSQLPSIIADDGRALPAASPCPDPAAGVAAGWASLGPGWRGSAAAGTAVEAAQAPLCRDLLVRKLPALPPPQIDVVEESQKPPWPHDYLSSQRLWPSVPGWGDLGLLRFEYPMAVDGRPAAEPAAGGGQPGAVVPREPKAERAGRAPHWASSV